MRRLLAAAVVRSRFGKAEAMVSGLAERDPAVRSLVDADELGRLCFLRREVRGSFGSEAAVSVELDVETGGRELSSVLIEHKVFVGARVDVHGLVAGQKDVILIELGVSAWRGVVVLAALGAVGSRTRLRLLECWCSVVHINYIMSLAAFLIERGLVQQQVVDHGDRDVVDLFERIDVRLHVDVAVPRVLVYSAETTLEVREVRRVGLLQEHHEDRRDGRQQHEREQHCEDALEEVAVLEDLMREAVRREVLGHEVLRDQDRDDECHQHPDREAQQLHEVNLLHRAVVVV